MMHRQKLPIRPRPRLALSTVLSAVLSALLLALSLACASRVAPPREARAGAATPLAELVEVIGQRLAVMPQVAEWKRLHDRPVRDRPRELRVLDAAVSAVDEAARQAGVAPLPAAAVRRFYQAQIDTAVGIQEHVLRQPPPKHTAAPDLETVIRPQLDRLGRRIAGLLVVQSGLPERAHLERLAGRHWRVEGLEPAAIERLLDALERLLARTESNSVVAQRYLSAIEEQDWQAMQGLLDTDARYQDFSMQHFGSAMIDLRGPEAIAGFWRQSSRDSATVSIRLDLSDRFVAGPNLVLRGHSEVRLRGSAWDLPLEMIETRFPQITHLRIVAGKVTHHTDHVDYGSAERQIAAQVESYNREHATQASFPVSPVDDDLGRQASDYLAALHRDDWETLERWLSPESGYLNFTAEAISGSIERADGGARIVELFREARSRSGTLELQLDVEDSFIAGPNVFLVGTYRVKTRGAAWGLESEAVSFRIPMVVHLRIVEGKVLDHVEYMDYATGFAALRRTPQ